jgi:hypothetical protein
VIPGWPPKDWRAFVALAASIAGAAVMTGMAAWLIHIVWKGGWKVGTEGQRLDTLGTALLLTLGIIGLILLGLGMAINRRSFKLGKDGIEASGGEGE